MKRPPKTPLPGNRHLVVASVSVPSCETVKKKGLAPLTKGETPDSLEVDLERQRAWWRLDERRRRLPHLSVYRIDPILAVLRTRKR